MIHEVNANLLEFSLDGFLHSCNCFHTMGAGIALRIKEKYPEMYKADVKHGRRGDIARLGQFSCVQCKDGKWGFNMYGQYNFGGWQRNTNYEAVYTSLYSICGYIESNLTEPERTFRLGLPNNMGCKLGGGSWIIVRAIIEEVFGTWRHELYICNYDG